MFCFGLAWLIFPIENRFYQKIVKNRTYYFPQIDFHNLRPLDPIRGLIQLSFLMFVAGQQRRCRQTSVAFDVCQPLLSVPLGQSHFQED